MGWHEGKSHFFRFWLLCYFYSHLPACCHITSSIDIWKCTTNTRGGQLNREKKNLSILYSPIFLMISNRSRPWWRSNWVFLLLFCSATLWASSSVAFLESFRFWADCDLGTTLCGWIDWLLSFVSKWFWFGTAWTFILLLMLLIYLVWSLFLFKWIKSLMKENIVFWKKGRKKTLCTFFIYKISTKILWKGKVESNDKKKAWLFM